MPQFQTALRDALNDLLESHLGTAPLLAGYTGSKPTNISDAASGTKLFEMTLPSDWMAASSSGVKSKSGTWEDSSANATGTLGYWELRKSDNTVIMRGTVGVGSGELQFLTLDLVSGQPVTITAFAWTAPGA
jgi:hypothetical protein